MKSLVVCLCFLFSCGDGFVDEPIEPVKESITLEKMEIVDCETGVTNITFLKDIMGDKATLVTIHTGWCGACKRQTYDLRSQYVEFKNDGFETVLIYIQDDEFNNSHDKLLSFACEKKKNYGLNFGVAIDPDMSFYETYMPGSAIPANLILDGDGKIRLRLPGYYPDAIRLMIKTLLGD
jgi:peroxiredoxin